jgi:single-stranded DNA-binding protein
MATRTAELEVGVNVGVVCGPCSGAPEIRVLESGARLATFGVRCPGGGGAGGGPGDGDRTTSVPVTVWNPAAWIETLEPGDAVVVVGRLRRRFFQRPGGVGSRVDLEAELVGRARDRRKVASAYRKALAALEALEALE